MIGSGRINIAAGIEDNTLAIIDFNTSKDSRDANDDRLAYLEAVRAASIVPENRIPPTRKMCQAVFDILRYGKTLELILASFQLLNELDQRYPRVYVSKSDSGDSCVLEMIHEAWSPFSVDITSSDKEEAAGENSRELIDTSGFHQLMQDLLDTASGIKPPLSDTRALANMLLLQYLVDFLEGDFVPRTKVYAETMNWKILKESLLNTLLASRRTNYKVLIKDCLSTILELSQFHHLLSNDKLADNPQDQLSESRDTALEIALLEAQKPTSIAIQKLMGMIMEFDASKKKADAEGSTTRANGVRTPLVNILLDQLTYDSDSLSTFLQVFDDPKWKLEIILQYFAKYLTKPSVQTRRFPDPPDNPTFVGILKCFSNSTSSRNISKKIGGERTRRLPDLPDNSTFVGILKCFSNSTSTRNVIKKIGGEVVQLLLSHGFQAHMTLSSLHVGGAFDTKEGSSLLEICNDIVSAFKSLRNTDKNMEILPLGKEAFFTAATILSTCS